MKLGGNTDKKPTQGRKEEQESALFETMSQQETPTEGEGVTEALAALHLGEEKESDPQDGFLEFNPLDSSGEDPSAMFGTDEDFVAALLSIDDDGLNNPGGGLIEGDDTEVLLPDIDVGFEEDVNDFLDPDQLGSVFEDIGYSGTNEVLGGITNGQLDQGVVIEGNNVEMGGTALESTVDNTNIVDVDHDTEQLYQDLKTLSLEQAQANDGEVPLFESEPIETEPFEPLNQTLPPITEDETLLEEDIRVGQSSNSKEDNLDELLKLSSLNLEENDDFVPEIGSRTVDDPQDPRGLHSLNPDIAQSASPFLDAFGATGKPKVRSCLGHRETIFGVTFSDCGKFCATASQDSTIHVWDVETNTLLASLNEHSKDYECLRVDWASSLWAADVLDRAAGEYRHLIASTGADGIVKLWGSSDPHRPTNWKCHFTLDHAELLGRSTEEESKEGDNKPQVYALQFIDHWSAFTTRDSDQTKNSFIMTSSDDYVHFWEIDTQPAEQSIKLEGNQIRLVPDTVKLQEVMSLHFESLEHYGYGVTACNITGSGLKLPPPSSSKGENTSFGGDRNPDNLVFVFDATYCSANGLLGVALSDGSLRLINGRGVCISILTLPGMQSHLTSFCWDKTGTRVATCVATGHLITWHLDINDPQGLGQIVATCSAIMEGGTY